MAAPLFSLENDLDARTFSLVDFATQTDDERLNVREDHRRRRWLGEDGPQCFALFGVHGWMLAKSDIRCNHQALAFGSVFCGSFGILLVHGQ